ncbi:MAG: ion transporter [Tabrizicola sp.]|uniref:ion transporter n=1 Tax=Tabrizicola sp. TaxID=2005166 RepID=UPI002AB87204|nr:ion transporter [Tabrizicola sp.]MDZ4085237.1 ion transporter [Tabrizicola sp.]
MSSRAAVAAFLDRPTVARFIIALILINAVTLGLETFPAVMARAGGLILAIDRLCLSIFVVELALRLFALGPRFFRSGWNVFDFVIIGISLLPATGSFSVLRAMRILRVLRVVSAVPSLRRVVDGLGRALPGMGSVFLLILIIYYIAAVMATKLFGASFPQWFGSLTATSFTLFQIMTLEGWSGEIVRPVMEVYPYAWAFFVPFILITTFAVLNLIVGLIVNSMQEAASEAEQERDQAFEAQVMERLTAIEKKLDARS